MGPHSPTGTPTTSPPDRAPTPGVDAGSEAITARRRALMGLLARARRDELEAALEELAPVPQAQVLRAPEVGLVMVRGRVGGEGAPFNLGEATLTRAAVRLDGGPDGTTPGVSYRLGRAPEAAQAAAMLDALWLQEDRRAAVEMALAPIAGRLAAEVARTAAKTAATKVDFFTLVRGED